jgi:hypothetical protein
VRASRGTNTGTSHTCAAGPLAATLRAGHLDQEALDWLKTNFYTTELDVYREMCGDPRGKPAVVLHGGPGSGFRATFDATACHAPRPVSRDHFRGKLGQISQIPS